MVGTPDHLGGETFLCVNSKSTTEANLAVNKIQKTKRNVINP